MQIRQIKVFVKTQNVVLLLIRRNLTITDLAKKIGMDVCNITTIINGKHAASSRFRQKLMAALDMPLEKFDEIFAIRENRPDKSAA